MKKLFVCLFTFLSFLVLSLTFNFANVKAEGEATATVVLGNVPNDCKTSNYGAKDYNLFTVEAFAGWFDAEKANENYGLVAFDGSEGDNKVTCSTKAGLVFENWKYAFNNNSVVIVLTAKQNGTFSTDLSACTNIDGWIDWNSGYIVRHRANDGTLTNLIWQYHLESDQEATFKSANTYAFTKDVLVGEKIYIEFGASAERNFQNFHEAKVLFTKAAPSELDIYVEEKAEDLQNYVNGLLESDYTTENWSAINAKVTEFAESTFIDKADVDSKFEAAITAIKAVATKEGLELKSASASYKTEYIPENLIKNEYGPIDRELFVINAYAGWFDAEKANENYGLVAFDGSNGEKVATCSTKTGLVFENWQYQFNNNSVVLAYDIKVNGKFNADFSTCGINGWIDWNSGYIVRHLKADGTLVEVLYKYHLDDSTPLQSNAIYSFEIDVKAGDVVYIEFGASAGRNIQNIHDSVMTLTTYEVNDIVFNKYCANLDEVVAELVEENYSESDWERIQTLVANFKNGEYHSLNKLDSVYNETVEAINAITPDPLKDAKTTATNEINALYNSLVEANYSEADWQTITNTKDTFLSKIETFETVDALNSELAAAKTAINAILPAKQTLAYLDLPSTITAHQYGWVNGKLFNYTAKTGKATELVAFDANPSGYEHAIINSQLGEATKLENWKWFISCDMGIIVIYEANVDMKLSVVDTRISGGSGENGWSEDCVLTSYIVRGENIKKIKSISNPTSDEDFSGEYYLKAGDKLYIELFSDIIDSSRNTESPYATTATADKNGFDQAKYDEQNHDLSKEVEDKVAECKAALEAYVATLKAEDYSETNWLTIAQYVSDFEAQALEAVETVDDVVEMFNEVKKEIEDTQTLAQAQAELQVKLDEVKAEVTAKYEELKKNNKYDEAHLAELLEIYNKALQDIDAAKSLTVAKNVKANAIAALAEVEVLAEEPTNKTSGCGSSIALTIAFIPTLFAVAFCSLKKKEER